MELVLFVVGFVTSVFISQVIYNVLFSPLRSIPGPFLARFTRLWELYSVRQRHSHMEFVRQHEKHGTFTLSCKKTHHPLTWSGNNRVRCTNCSKSV